MDWECFTTSTFKRIYIVCGIVSLHGGRKVPRCVLGMGFEPMISGMKILRPRPTRRTERQYLVYNHFLSSASWIATKPSNLARCGNFEESNKIEVTRQSLPHKSLWDRSKSHRVGLRLDSTMEQSV